MGFTAVSAIITIIFQGADGLTLLYDVVPGIIAVVCGAFLTPLFLPYIPGRAFSLKGALVAVVFSGLFVGVMVPPLSYSIFMVGTVVAISSFLAINFTGAGTFTSLSGVKKEMRYSLPFQAGMIVVAIVGRIITEVLLKAGGGV
ncbi:MAG TPA: hypothetical protein VJ967_06080 [Clostridia bacterium]|nr:hypothetical protein [Clostridia bacterium]